MLDPFPIPAIPAIRRLFIPLAQKLHLTTLPLHAHEVLLAALFYHCICAYASPWISSRLFPRIYTSLNKKTRLNWDVHVVSLVQCTSIVAYAFYLMAYDDERRAMTGAGWEQRLHGYTGASGFLQAAAAGYFLWDLCLCTRHVAIFGPGLMAHAISAFSVYMLGFRPFFNYYGTVFILYECSSFFLNFHWFFDKLGMSGSTPQFINGVLLILSFFSCRLVWGTWGSIRAFGDAWQAIRAGAKNQVFDDEVGPLVYGTNDPKTEVMMYAGDQTTPIWVPLVYLTANTVLNFLNVYWFGKMIETLRKRFDPPLGTKGVEKEKKKYEAGDADRYGSFANGRVTIQKGVDAEGRKSIELEGTSKDVRKRPPLQRDFSVSEMM